MGYTHYLQRPPEIENFGAIALATKVCCEAVRKLGIDIVGGHGEPDSEPEFDYDRIWFNGSSKQKPGQWTAEGSFGIVWPSNKSKPIPASDTVVSGQWFGGAELEKRIAPNGDGSYETLNISRVYKVNEWSEKDENGNYFDFCKTAYRPYDILVMCAYLVTKYYDNRCVIGSDGQANEWKIAVAITAKALTTEEKELWKLLEVDS